jgi:glycosyltransferase involved in cell wall biosynthesis
MAPGLASTCESFPAKTSDNFRELVGTMRVLHLLSSTGFHGAENMAAELIRQLSEQGVDNHLGVFRSSNRSNLDIQAVTQRYIKNGTVFDCHGRFDVRTVFALRKYINRHDIDIIHSHKYKTNLYAVLANFGLRKKLVSTCHNWLGQSLAMRFYAWLDKRILRSFDMVVGVSNEIVAELAKHLPPHKILRIGNGIDIQKYRRPVSRDEAKRRLHIGNRHVIGFVGRLSPEKGIGYLLRAASNLIKEGLDVCTVIVGDGEQAGALKEEARVLQIADRVIFTGNRNDTPMLYAAMDVFVLPSLQEAFPMVLLEAMACGVPVIATRVGDVAEIIEPDTTGMLVETKDDIALQNAIKKMLTYPVEAERMSAAARMKVEQCFSSAAMAKQYHFLYQRVTDFNHEGEKSE